MCFNVDPKGDIDLGNVREMSGSNAEGWRDVQLGSWFGCGLIFAQFFLCEAGVYWPVWGLYGSMLTEDPKYDNQH